MPKVSVVLFPGSNCDHDVVHAFRSLRIGAPQGEVSVDLVWHASSELKDPDLVVLPGGFSFGDYVRTGALAKLSPIARAVHAFAAAGGHVLGICNGFQILCELGLLPGVLLRNQGRTFLSRQVHLRVEPSPSFFSSPETEGRVVSCPIAHGEGNYFADEQTLAELEDHKQVVFRYCRQDGSVHPEDPESNPNGSKHAIAGICNREGNVVGLMPHPERALEALVGGASGDRCRELLETYAKAVFHARALSDKSARISA